MLRKWETDSVEIKGILETLPQGGTMVKFRGTVKVAETVAVVFGGTFAEIEIDLSSAEFQYQDGREAPEHLRKWSATHFEGLLIVLAPFWKRSIF